MVTLAVTGTVALYLQVFYPSFRFPDIKRQVPRSLFETSDVRSTSQFGFELGLGWRTKLTTLGTQWIALGIVLLPSDVWVALSVGLGFAVGRYLHFLVRLFSGRGEQWDRLLEARRHVMTLSSVVAIVLFSFVSFRFF